MDPRLLAQALFGARIVIGATLIAAPGFVAERWIGPDGRKDTVQALARAVGVRDLVLGLGGLRALHSDQRARPWVDAGIASDAVDATATWMAIRHIGPAHALPTIAMAKVGVLIGLVARGRVD